jgi:hypothetical protein
VIATEEGPHLFFLGEDILFEGFKTAIEGGYGWTMVYTDKEYLTTRLTIFDMLFQSAKKYTLQTYGSDDSAGDGPEALRRAVVKAITMARDGENG